jgi:hypothetical protein
MCILTIYYQGAFDATSHYFLEAVLLQFGFSEIMKKSNVGLYDGATSSAQINGYISAPSTYIPHPAKDAH